jgi:ethanolamine ammonia-lyase large subunit
VKPFKPLGEIRIPEPVSEEDYRGFFRGRDVRFRGLKKLLGAADYSKAGERHSGLAAGDDWSREAARSILGGLTLGHLYDHPVTDDQGKIDSVMRVNYDIDLEVFSQIRDMTLAEVKDRLLSVPGEEIKKIGAGLTGVMAAALAKLCDIHELIFVASKIHTTTRARTSLGAPGTLASRLQPNHPTDDLKSIRFLCEWGLSIT